MQQPRHHFSECPSKRTVNFIEGTVNANDDEFDELEVICRDDSERFTEILQSYY